MLKLPQRTTSRLRLENFTDSYQRDFPSDKYGTNNKNFDSSTELRTKTKSINKINIKEKIVNNPIENKIAKKRCRELKINIKRLHINSKQNFNINIEFNNLEAFQRRDTNQHVNKPPNDTANHDKGHITTSSTLLHKSLTEKADRKAAIKHPQISDKLLNSNEKYWEKLEKSSRYERSLDKTLKASGSLADSKTITEKQKQNKLIVETFRDTRVHKLCDDVNVNVEMLGSKLFVNNSIENNIPKKRCREFKINIEKIPLNLAKKFNESISPKSARQDSKKLCNKTMPNSSNHDKMTKISSNELLYKPIREVENFESAIKYPTFSFELLDNKKFRKKTNLERSSKMQRKMRPSENRNNFKNITGEKVERGSTNVPISEETNEEKTSHSGEKEISNKILKEQPSNNEFHVDISNDNNFENVTKVVVRHKGSEDNIVKDSNADKKRKTASSLLNCASNGENSTISNHIQIPENIPELIENKKKQPNKNSRPKSTKQSVGKVILPKQFLEKKYTKLSKLTKQQIKKVASRKIPKDRLDDVLDMFNNDNHPIWEDRNVSCNPSIHRYWEPCAALVSDQNMKLKYARQFLLRRDWISLSRVLSLPNLEAKAYYPLMSKYGAILLAHTDKEQFGKFIQFLIGMTDSTAVLKKCTQITKGTEK